ncbi:Maleamate amidohydrolase [Neomoorella glycerini]|uniref:Maleamate amidohydrolase n=1 Tax=Neomoorella glycerini TaxID=55779 RepID=A0A6I5ZM90_9FIRM|nr:isochorismatase family protein [Moorella glycerini]QGP90992.1 Maleamate amidohydrolase [Moorella glycerini]
MVWDKLLADTDLAGYRAGGHGRRIGFGYKPAIIVVDMINLYASPRFALGHGDNVGEVIQANARLLAAARLKSVPIFYSKVGLRSTAAEKGIWGEKVAGSKGITTEADKIVDELAPQEGDVIVTKPKASAFFGTQLAGMLFYLGVDTIIVTGLTTSGCVRATVVDGFSYNFRVIVPVECVGDRAALPHKVSLFDMDMKYADVVELQEVLNYLEQLGRPQFPFA